MQMATKFIIMVNNIKNYHDNARLSYLTLPKTL